MQLVVPSFDGHVYVMASVYDALANAGRVCPAELRDVVDHCIRNSQIHNDTLVAKVDKAYAKTPVACSDTGMPDRGCPPRGTFGCSHRCSM